MLNPSQGIAKGRDSVLLRLLLVGWLLSLPLGLSARGRTRGYQAGGGIHRSRAKQRAKQPKDKQPRKPSPPADTKTIV